MLMGAIFFRLLFLGLDFVLRCLSAAKSLIIQRLDDTS